MTRSTESLHVFVPVHTVQFVPHCGQAGVTEGAVQFVQSLQPLHCEQPVQLLQSVHLLQPVQAEQPVQSEQPVHAVHGPQSGGGCCTAPSGSAGARDSSTVTTSSV